MHCHQKWRKKHDKNKLYWRKRRKMMFVLRISHNKHSSCFMVFHCILCMFQYQVASVASSEMHKIHIFLWKNKYIECSWSCSAGMHTKSNKNRLTKAKRIAIVSRMVGIDPVYFTIFVILLWFDVEWETIQFENCMVWRFEYSAACLSLFYTYFLCLYCANCGRID